MSPRLACVFALITALVGSAVANAASAALDARLDKLEVTAAAETAGPRRCYQSSVCLNKNGHGVKWHVKAPNVTKVEAPNGWNFKVNSGNFLATASYDVYFGILKAPLDYDDPENSPTVSLSIVMYMGVGMNDGRMLYSHPGGPGSSAVAAASKAATIATLVKNATDEDKYFAVGISQRGVRMDTLGSSKENARSLGGIEYGPDAREELNAMPTLQCTPDTLKRPAKDLSRWGQFQVDEFTSCNCALPNGAPATAETWADVDPANRTEVRSFFEAIQTRNTKCYNDPRFIMTGKNQQVYNYLDYLGTNVLTLDLDLFRKSLGKDKLNIKGSSYGTCVASAFSTIFKDKIGTVQLDSNCPPNPESGGFAMGTGRAAQQGFDKLLEMCSGRAGRLDGPPCLGGDPFGKFDRLVAEIRSPGLYAESPLHPNKTVRLGLGMFIGFMSNCLNLQPWRQTCIGHLEDLTSGDPKKKERKVAEILDVECTIMDADDNTRGVITWQNYGVCIHASHVGIGGDTDDAFQSLVGKPFANRKLIAAGGGAGAFLDQAGILGIDYFGRYSLNSAMRKWNAAFNLFGVTGTPGFLGWFGAMFDWQVVPDPIRSGGVPPAGAKVIVTGNLYDPGTPFEFTMAMRKAFPESSLLVSQAVGHIVEHQGGGKGFGDRNDAAYISAFSGALSKCSNALIHFWANDTYMPADGMICKQDSPIQ